MLCAYCGSPLDEDQAGNHDESVNADETELLTAQTGPGDYVSEDIVAVGAGFRIRLWAFTLDVLVIWGLTVVFAISDPDLLLSDAATSTDVAYVTAFVGGGMLVKLPYFYSALTIFPILSGDSYMTGIAVYAVKALFCIVSLCSMSATVGKKLTGLTVVGIDGQRVGFHRSAVRFLAYTPSLFFFAGFVVMWARNDNRALHDLIAGTVVVKQKAVSGS